MSKDCPICRGVDPDCSFENDQSSQSQEPAKVYNVSEESPGRESIQCKQEPSHVRICRLMFDKSTQSQEPASQMSHEGTMKIARQLLEDHSQTFERLRISELESQLEQAKKLHETDREINRSLANHNSRITEQLEQACTPDQVKERIESVQREWKHHCDKLQEQLTQAQAESETMKSVLKANQAETLSAIQDMKKAQAEASRYREALERIIECDKGKWYDVTHIASEALAQEAPRDPVD